MSEGRKYGCPAQEGRELTLPPLPRSIPALLGLEWNQVLTNLFQKNPHKHTQKYFTCSRGIS